MKKILACSAALSLMLMACGDDASSTSPEQPTGGKTNAAGSYHPGECLAETACAQDEGGKAYLVSGEGGGYQVFVPSVSFPRSAWIEGDYFSERSGDTLYIWDEKKDLGGAVSMPQPCVADLVFDIPAEDADIKFFKHFDDVYQVVSGPSPQTNSVCGVESSGSQPASSGSQPSSSGSQNPESSADVGSSSSVAGNPVQKVKVFGKCMESKGRSDIDIPGGDGLALPPHALMGQEDGSDKVIVAVDHVMMPDYQIGGFAGMVINPALLDSIEVMAVGDTLYVKQIVDEAKAEGDSKCVAEFHFVMKDEPAFTNTSFIVVDNYLRSPIDKESYVQSSSSVVSRSVAVPVSNVSLACLANHYFDGSTIPEGDLAEPYPNLGQITRIDGMAKLGIINTYLNLPCSGDSAVVNAAVNEAKTAIARSGANLIDDTLFVNIDRSKDVEYTCGCNAKVEFLFDGQYADFGYTVFDNNEPTEVLDAAKDRPHQKIENVDAKCSTRGNSDDPLVDGGTNDMALPPVAYMYDLGNYAQIVIETVQLTCGTQFKYIDVSVGGDTLYVKPVVDESSLQADCICSTMLDFKIDMDEDFWNASLLVFDYGWGYNPSNKMRIVQQRHVIEVPN